MYSFDSAIENLLFWFWKGQTGRFSHGPRPHYGATIVIYYFSFVYNWIVNE